MALSSSQKQSFYSELAKLTLAGFGVREAAAVMRDTRVPAAQAAALTAMDEGLKAGKTISESFAGVGWITDLERSTIAAGERGGPLEAAFQHLADYYGLLSEAWRETVMGLMYPLIMIHVGIIAGALIPVLGGKETVGHALVGMALTLAELYAVGAVLWLAARGVGKAAGTNAGLDKILRRIPLVGGLRRNMALARFTKVYHVCVLAGLSISESVQTAGEASQSGVILEVSRKLTTTAREGNRLGPEFISSGVFPPSFARSYSTAEESGGLDRDLARWAGLYQEESKRSAKRLATWLPKTFFVIMALYVGWQVWSFFKDYYGQIGQGDE